MNKKKAIAASLLCAVVVMLGGLAASAASIGAAGFDIGNAIFSMHSIREFGGTYDVKYATDFFRAYHR